MSTALPGPTSSSAAAPSSPRTIDAPVRRVTLLEDRAQVRREGGVTLEPGSHRLVIAGVAPVASDRSLVARATGDARVLEARLVRRVNIGRAELPPADAALEGERRQLEEAARAGATAQRLLQARLAREEHALSLVVDGINREVLHAQAFEARWEQDLGAFLEAVRELKDRLRQQAEEAGELRSRGAVAALHAAQQDDLCGLATTIEVEVLVERAGRVTLGVDYMVPCALWRPIHRATLLGGDVRFECEAAVWQATGEDWEDVELLFSTARPTQRAEPPLLTDDRLRVQRRADRSVQVAVREEAIATTGEGTTRRQAELPGVDDGGETRTLPAAARASIRSSGLLHRAPIFSFEAAAEVDRIARPERSALVHLRSRFANASSQPILAGPVELLRESGFVGRGEVGFVAPGEKLVLGWGADDGVRVRREQKEEREVARLTGKQTITSTVTLSLSNLEAVPATFRVEERVPVSELEQVKVELDEKKTAPPARPDAQGIVGWQVTVPARGTKTVVLVYRIVAASAVQGL